MSPSNHINLRPDQLYLDCLARVKGNDACKHFEAKMIRHGIDFGVRERSPTGRPYFDYKIVVNTRSAYAKLMKIIDSTEKVEQIVD